MVMSAEVSRTIAAFVADMSLGQEAARLLAEQYADVASADELPEWLTEDSDDEPNTRAAGHDTARSEVDADPPIAVIRAYAELELDEDIERAAGKDVKPGHDELHHYWVAGEGLAKWSGSPKPWTTLVALLTPHVGAAKAKVFASRWFYEVKGYYSGSDKNRVATGHPPRGHRIGPG